MKEHQTTGHLPQLPNITQPIIDEMQSGEVQGASRRIRQINDLFAAIASGWTASPLELIETIIRTGDYFISTRGRNSPAIGNAIRQTLLNIEELSSSSIDDIKTFIKERRDQNNQKSYHSAEIIAEIGANLFFDFEVIMPFDYSGTSMGILSRIAKRGKTLKLIVPESRSIQGGLPIVKQATKMGHTVQFIVDLAVTSYMNEVQAVLIGAEGFLANGDCWNTLGGSAISIISNYYNVPFYVATDLIKIDPESFKGIMKNIKLRDYSALFNHPSAFDTPDKVSVIAPDIDKIPSSLITAYITEEGVLSPPNIYYTAMRYLENSFDFDLEQLEN
jgi:ribose 1,5-bisphosphate isomerase